MREETYKRANAEEYCFHREKFTDVGMIVCILLECLLGEIEHHRRRYLYKMHRAAVKFSSSIVEPKL